MTSEFSWQNSVSIYPASFCTPKPNLPVTSGISWLPTFAFQSPMMKRTSFFDVSSRSSRSVLHRTGQLQLFQHQTLFPSPVTSTSGHCIHTWVLIPLWLSLFLPSGTLALLFSSSILSTYWPGEFIFQCYIFLSFHTSLRVLKARILKWFAILFSSRPFFFQISPPWPVSLGWPYMAWLIVPLS